jgi:hypothetical protein
MTEQDRALDIQIRLPENKKHLKNELKKIAKKNRLSLTQLITFIFEWWLEERKKGTEFKIPVE